jgi:hypothetical protein
MNTNSADALSAYVEAAITSMPAEVLPMNGTSKQEVAGVGVLNEKALHAALKDWYAQPDDMFEVKVNGSVIDIVRGDLLIEIQTRGFSALRRKLKKLVQSNRVHLVYPVAQEKWIVKLDADGITRLGRRKSPKRGTILEVFRELVSFPHLLLDPNFSLEVLLIKEEETRQHDPSRAWRRRGWVTQERSLLQVVESRVFETPADVTALIPPSVCAPFTTADLAEALDTPRWLTQKMAYCLRGMGEVEEVGKQGRSILYARVCGTDSGVIAHA